jgi:hypothetical protein
VVAHLGSVMVAILSAAELATWSGGWFQGDTRLLRRYDLDKNLEAVVVRCWSGAGPVLSGVGPMLSPGGSGRGGRGSPGGRAATI